MPQLRDTQPKTSKHFFLNKDAEKEPQTKSRASRKETDKTLEQNVWTRNQKRDKHKRWFIEKTDKIDRLLA